MNPEGSTPVMFLTALSGYIASSSSGTVNPGLARLITFSTAFASHPTLRTLVCHRLSVINFTVIYVLVLLDYVSCEIRIPPPSHGIASGFLFLCPTEHFRIGPSSFCWPDCPAYWSLDPSGVERLTAEEATDLGFPSLEFYTTVSVRSWDASVYAGIREFHQAKGFDPESQDVARYMGYPLYQLFDERDPPFVHG